MVSENTMTKPSRGLRENTTPDWFPSVLKRTVEAKRPAKAKASMRVSVFGRSKTATVKRYTDAMNENIETYRTNTSRGAREMSIREPSTIRSAMSPTHARTPTKPVVTSDVGMKPIPEVKSTFQKAVELSDASRYLSHSAQNVPGPEPKTGVVA